MDEKSIKWIVVGVIALVSIFVFRDEIGKLIGRTKELDISPKGLKVVTTPIGETTVSAQNVSAKLYIGPDKSESNIYVDEQYKFAISWPPNSEWVPSNKMTVSQRASMGLGPSKEANEATFFLFRFATSLNRPGIVSVTAYPSEFYKKNIQALFDDNIKVILAHGATVLSSAIDENTGGAVIVHSDERQGLNGVNRLIMSDKYAYIVQATPIYPPGEEYAKLRNEQNMILNSFRILY